MAPTSQNGWSVLESAPPPVDILDATGRRVARLTLRPGDVAFVLSRVARWFHDNIEPLDMPVKESPGYDDWGWAYRAVRGQSTGFSNHASGTAEDLNATQHPRGVKGTFTAAEKAEIRTHLKGYDGVIRWGEDYSGTVDGMHFEINDGVTAAELAIVARRLRAQDAQKENDVALSAEDIEKIAKRAAELTVARLLDTKTEVFRDGDGDGKRDTYTVRQCLAATPIAQTAVERLDALTQDVSDLADAVDALKTPPAPAGG